MDDAIKKMTEYTMPQSRDMMFIHGYSLAAIKTKQQSDGSWTTHMERPTSLRLHPMRSFPSKTKAMAVAKESAEVELLAMPIVHLAKGLMIELEKLHKRLDEIETKIDFSPPGGSGYFEARSEFEALRGTVSHSDGGESSSAEFEALRGTESHSDEEENGRHNLRKRRRTPKK